MKKFLALIGCLALLSGHAFASNVTVPSPVGIWDNSSGTLQGFGIPGQGTQGYTAVQTLDGSGNALIAGTLGVTGNFAVNTNKFSVTAASGNTAVAGTLAVTGAILNPVINGPAPLACGATCTLTAASAGTTTLLNQAAGSTVTLPAATGTGNIFPMMISVATTSAAEKILTSPTTDTIIGTAIGENAGTAKIFVGNAGTFHSIQMPNAGTQPSGGFIGDNIVCKDVAAGIWQCQIIYQAGTTPTTPYSASTS